MEAAASKLAEKLRKKLAGAEQHHNACTDPLSKGKMAENICKLRERLHRLHQPPQPSPAAPAAVAATEPAASDCEQPPAKRRRIAPSASPMPQLRHPTGLSTSPAARAVVPGLVSICLPVHNCAPYLGECLASILTQSHSGEMELSVFDDGSTDGSDAILEEWLRPGDGKAAGAIAGSAAHWRFVSSRGVTNRGEGHARNCAVVQSAGEYLCVMDADDRMLPTRIATQLAVCQQQPHAIIGARFVREPEDATWHYTAWANGLSTPNGGLLSQQYREVTLLHPTWFLHRDVYESVGGYVECADNLDELPPPPPGASEQELAERRRRLEAGEAAAIAVDLRFFHAHLDQYYRNHRPGTGPSRVGPAEDGDGGETQPEQGEEGVEVIALHRAYAGEQPLQRHPRPGAHSPRSGGSDSQSGAAAAAAAAAGRGSAAKAATLAASQRVGNGNLNGASVEVHGGALLVYRHRPGLSMCAKTPRRTLLRLRVRAFERRVLDGLPSWCACLRAHATEGHLIMGLRNHM
eukprot:COSAG05_NODE_262_length_12684_cov_2.601430_4_plen_520_part_00